MVIITVLEALAVSAMGATAIAKIQYRLEQRKVWQRNEQLLVHGLRLRGIDQPMAARFRLSERRIEMERLLGRLTESANFLATALASESNTVEVSTTARIDDWRTSRATVAAAQSAYNEAINNYQAFVQELPAPVRAKATEQAMMAMKAILA